MAECIAHFESTDGAWLVNGPNLGPWQDSVDAHRFDARRILWDWWYAARVTRAIAWTGRSWDWSPWSTHGDCGV